MFAICRSSILTVERSVDSWMDQLHLWTWGLGPVPGPQWKFSKAVGTLPALIDILKSFVRMGPILEALSMLSIIPEMLSGPLAFGVSSLMLSNISNTSASSEPSNSIGQSKGFKCGSSSLVRGGKAWLNKVAKKD